MPETSVIFVGGDGWTDMAPDLPEERTTTAVAFHKPWWQGVKIYHRNGYVYEVEKAEPETELPPMSKVLAKTVYNPDVKARYEYHSTGFYRLDDLKKVLNDAARGDSNALTKFHGADELCDMIAKADSYDDVVEVLVYARSEILNI